ncbi:hypothetical protein L218DRAFT_703202 [Marasmius fiardii PR-910]|nr:hypothetical protein L218DRAFT_703202 [Marasmius fiardii PR-910]
MIPGHDIIGHMPGSIYRTTCHLVPHLDLFVCHGYITMGPSGHGLMDANCGEVPVANTQRLEQRLDSQQLVPRQRQSI